MTAASTALQPSGPIIGGGETLRRTVTEAQTADDGKPMSSAFHCSSHDSMMSTFQGYVSGEEAVTRWVGKSPVDAVWPVETDLLKGLLLQSYADGGKPCACPAECSETYPPDHASVDLRLVSRKDRERHARAMKARAVGLGPIYPSS